MTDGPNIAEVAALVGDPARAKVLIALMDGRALTAKELAFAAGVSPQTASGHLAKLSEGHLLTCIRQGRHRYYRVASPLVARMLESISLVAAIEAPPRHRPRSMRDDALRLARTCYDHLAGRLGVAIADALVARGAVILSDDGGEVTTDGAAFLADRLALDLGQIPRRRAFCRPCLDWSERRLHLAGAVGAALAERCFALGWIERIRDSRAVAITPRGQIALRELFRIDEESLRPAA
jgi:DNA-binding transcriptional ArsR family regulator